MCGLNQWNYNGKRTRDSELISTRNATENKIIKKQVGNNFKVQERDNRRQLEGICQGNFERLQNLLSPPPQDKSGPRCTFGTVYLVQCKREQNLERKEGRVGEKQGRHDECQGQQKRIMVWWNRAGSYGYKLEATWLELNKLKWWSISCNLIMKK